MNNDNKDSISRRISRRTPLEKVMDPNFHKQRECDRWIYARTLANIKANEVESLVQEAFAQGRLKGLIHSKQQIPGFSERQILRLEEFGGCASEIKGHILCIIYGCEYLWAKYHIGPRVSNAEYLDKMNQLHEEIRILLKLAPGMVRGLTDFATKIRVEVEELHGIKREFDDS